MSGTTNPSSLTPMMQQYMALKEKAQDAILFFRMGDFFEIFGDDALRVAPVLDLVLTSRERGDSERIPFCGVPHHSAKNYWIKLLRLGFKVALADQVEDPALAKGLVKREITRILTPGCIDDLDALDAASPNYLMVLLEDPKSRVWVMVLADVSTGEMRCGVHPEFSGVCLAVEKMRPREILVRKFLLPTLKERLSADFLASAPAISALSEGLLRDEEKQAFLVKTVFGAEDLANQPCGFIQGGLAAVAGTLDYLRTLGLVTDQFLQIKPLQDPETMALDETVIRDLELFETTRRRSREGSFIHEIDRTLSPMGARHLRNNMASPLLSVEKIAARQKAVRFFLEQGVELLQDVRLQLKGIADLERLTTRVLAGSATPQEVAKVRATLQKVAVLASALERKNSAQNHYLTARLKEFSLAEEPLTLLQDALAESPTTLFSDLNVFRVGFDAVLDEKRNLAQSGSEEINRYEAKQRERSGINSLKIKHHKTYGLLIEVTKTNLSKVPEDFIRRQTMVNCERFVTVELQELGEALASAQAEAFEREQALFAGLLAKLAAYKEGFRYLAFAIADLDLIQSFAWKARESAYVLPHTSNRKQLCLKGARHPVVEAYVGKHNFVPNDVEMGVGARNLVITGPNMAGKSTVMRLTALCALLHQLGAPVPAAEAELPVFDRIFTRVGASDDLSRGQSTFMVEMAEAAHILRQATDASLVILDEVGRGTSTQDGMAIAAAILEDLSFNVGCYCLFATHYHEIIPLARNFPGIKTMQTEVRETVDGIEFTHRLVSGECDSSFGVEVAKLAGLPNRVIEKAQNYLKGFPVKVESLAMDKESKVDEVLPLERFGLCSVERTHAREFKELVTRLEGLVIQNMTPLEALNILSDLKQLYEDCAH